MFTPRTDECATRQQQPPQRSNKAIVVPSETVPPTITSLGSKRLT
ncbi:MAG: hypothetical protein QXF61_11405 [Nitrososphaeria archaeon]